ncbi:MAG TPA: hypothetical protein VF678_09030 [bacterium]
MLTLIFGLLLAIAVVIPFWRLFQRLGYSPYLSLLMLVPFVNLGLMYYVAFLDWPGEQGAEEIEDPRY